jgi:hypothetical protein
LNLNGAPLPFAPLDADALRVVESVIATRRSAVLVPPDPLVPTAALVPAAMHVASIVAASDGGRRAASSSLRIAASTDRWHTRGVYRGLRVRSQVLWNVVPAGSLGPDGTLRLLGAREGLGQHASTIFVPRAADLKRVPRFDAAVIDLQPGDQEADIPAGVPVVVIARDPGHPLVRRVASTMPVFAWSNDEERALGSGARPPLRQRNRLAGLETVAVRVVSPRVCEAAGLFWRDVGQFLRLGGGSALGRTMATHAFSLFHDLVGLAMPLAQFESATQPLAVHLRAIGQTARLLDRESRGDYVPRVETVLQAIGAALSPVPPKCEALAERLRRHVKDGLEVLLVVRTSYLVGPYTEHLRRLHLDDVRVTSLGGLESELPVDVAVLTGMAPSWARWVYRSGIARLVEVLSYDPGPECDAVDLMFNEARMVDGVARDQDTLTRWLSRGAAKSAAWNRLTGQSIAVPPVPGEHRSPAAASAPRLANPTEPPRDVPPGLWAERNWFAEIGSGGVGEASHTVHVDPGALVEALRLCFTDGREATLARDGVVSRLAQSGNIEQDFSVSRIKVGDRLVFLDGDASKGLLTKVLEVADHVPALAVAAGWISCWRRARDAARSKYGSYEDLTRALHALGCKVQSQTVRLWILGVTIGPVDPVDVKRLAEVCGDPGLSQCVDQVVVAMRVVRSAHVSLGQRLGRLARSVGAATAVGRIDADEIVDAASGLTAADFAGSVEILTVKSVNSAGRIPALYIGRIETNAEARHV